MNRIAKVALLMVLLTTATLSVAQAQQEKVMVDRVVAVVGNSMVLYSDMAQIESQLSEQRRQQGVTSDRDSKCEALEILLLQKLLANQAKIDSIEINMVDLADRVQQAIDGEVAKFGSQQALENYYHKAIYDIRDMLMDRYEEMRYASTMEQTVKGDVEITPGDVERYYRKLPKDSLPEIPEQYVYSQIVCYPPSVDEAKYRARTRLLEMRQRIQDGTKFEVLARMYSQDPGSAMRGGEMDPTPKETYVETFANALAELQVGQVSEVVETEYGYHLIELIDTDGTLYHCRHILLKPQFTDEEIADVVKTLDSVSTEIKAGNLAFKDAVEEHTEDRFSKNLEGVVSNLEIMEVQNYSDPRAASTRFVVDELAPEVYRVLRTLKNGEVSSAFASQDMRGNVIAKLIKLDTIIPAHTANLKDDFLRIEQIATLEKQEDEYNKWLKGKVKGMFIKVDEEYRLCEFERPYLLD